FEKKRASSGAEWERRKQLDRQREKERREKRRRQQTGKTEPPASTVDNNNNTNDNARDNTTTIVSSVASDARKEHHGGILKLGTRTQKNEMKNFLERKRNLGDDSNLRNYEPKDGAEASSSGRTLGDKPTIEDLRKVTFKQSNKFRL